ncbi:hypothetical protein BJY19_001672 [Arthrobacter cupressi]|nr:hypothetical protein [Arthrobacter cupressi]
MLAMLLVGDGVVVAGRDGIGAMLCMLARASLRRMLPHATGTAAVIVFRSAVVIMMLSVLDLGVLVRGRLVLEVGLVARGVDCVYDLLVRDVRRDRDAGGFEGEVDGGFDALELAELAFHPGYAGGAGHALDIQFDDAGTLLFE